MNDHDDFTTQLTRSLTDQSDTMVGSHLGLAEVKGKVRSIRRRRATGAVVAVAAAVAIVVPTIDLAGHSGGKPEPAPATQITQSPTQTATVDSGHQPKPGVLDVSDLPTGAGPHLQYVTGGHVLHQVDGSTIDVATRYPITAFATLIDGSHVWQTMDAAGNAYVEVQDQQGTLHRPLHSDIGLRVNREHNAAAWVDSTGRVDVWTIGATAPRPLGAPVPGVGEPRIAAVVSQDCRDFCTVYVNASGDNGQQQPFEVSDSGTKPFTDGGLVTVNDVASGLTIGYSTLTDTGSCSDLFGGGEFQGFTTCRATLSSLSPDGSLVLGYPPYFDGLGPTSLSMWEVTGNRLFERRADARHQATVGDAAWEDGSHVLASMFQGGRWSLVRVASDGTMEYAVPPVRADDVDNPFVVETGGPTAGD